MSRSTRDPHDVVEPPPAASRPRDVAKILLCLRIDPAVDELSRERVCHLSAQVEELARANGCEKGHGGAMRSLV